jgi:hypothetical protein
MFCLLLRSDSPRIKFRSEIAEYLDFFLEWYIFLNMIIVHCKLMFCAYLSHTLCLKYMLTDGWWEKEI